MKLPTCLSIFHFVSTVLLILQPTTQAKKLSDSISTSRTALPRPRAIRSAPESNPCLNSDTTRGFRVEYTLITANSPDCESSLVDNFPVRVQYRMIQRSEGSDDQIDGVDQFQPSSKWTDSICTPSYPTDCENNLDSRAAAGNMPVHVRVRSYSLQFPSGVDHVNDSQRIQLRLVQSDHRGGFCDCWAVSDLRITFVGSGNEISYQDICVSSGVRLNSLSTFLGDFGINQNTTNTCASATPPNSAESVNSYLIGFCRGSASVLRGFVGAETQSQCEHTAAVVDTDKTAPLMGDQCESMPHINIRFSLLFGGRNNLNSFDEGAEFSFRKINDSNGEWIPLMFFSSVDPKDRNNAIMVGQIHGLDTVSSQVVNIRGYDVPYVIGSNDGIQALEANLSICGSEISSQNGEIFTHIQFRWLQTVQQASQPNRDTIFLDNITITSSLCSTLLMDDFDYQTTINDTRWMDVQQASLQCDGQQKCRVQFGKNRPTFFPLSNNNNDYRSTIISRGILTVPLDPSPPTPILRYTLITASSPTCLNTNPSFTASPPRLEYHQGNDEWKTLNYCGSYVLNFTSDLENNLFTAFVADLDEYSDRFQFRFVQLDHRGGYCDCWAVADLAITDQGYTNTLSETCDETGKYTQSMENMNYYYYDVFGNSHEELQGSIVAEFCGGSASVARGFVTHKVYLNNSQSTGDYSPPSCDDESVVVDSKDSPATECNDTELRMEITFDLDFLTGSDNCDSIDSFHEGVELSFRSVVKDEEFEDTTLPDNEWIPLMYFTSNQLNIDDDSAISLVENETLSNETRGSFMLRGYSTPYAVASKGRHRVTLCGEADLLDYPMEFRWLQTSSLDNRSITEDVVVLDNISISLQNSSYYASLFDGGFEEDPSSLPDSTLLKRDNIWLLNTTSTNDCKPYAQSRGALVFYTQPAATYNESQAADVHYAATISSRQLVIGPLDPTNVTLEPRLPALTTPPPVTTEGFTSSAAALESEILELIDVNPTLSGILTLIEDSPQLALEGLASVLDETGGGDRSMESNSTAADVSLSAAAYLLSRVGSVLGNESVEPAISNAFVSVANNLLETAQRRTAMAGTNVTVPDSTAGSTLLQVLERFALNNHDTSHPPPPSDNIVFHVQELLMAESSESVTPIREDITEISIPSEVFASQDGVNPIRMASFLFRNMSGLLPQRLGNNGAENYSDSDDLVFRLASPVISASFQCDTCTTSNLSTPVQVTFKHTPYDTTLLENDVDDSEVNCVFWDFNDVQRRGAVLFEGQWSDEGCQVNKDLSTPAMTVCECNHLTNFAILLSARPPTFTPPQALTLQIIGYIGVSVSLVAMAVTVFVFLFQKPLRTMRNYIHIQLCVTLGIAQIIFVAGIEPHLGEGRLVGGVPVGCRLVAVLLHYWFLVSFMWMLMEGVVLYVGLVRVFVKHHARYIAAFTIASYGLPLLYVGGLTVPLGFARSEEMRNYQIYDYGYEQACYLNPATSFVWSLIAPVILIIMANIGFFIMAIVIMTRHQKRQYDKEKAKQVRHWLKASISLTVVMGITWIIGVLVIEVEELFALAFIFTIFVAFQGLFIFVIFVLLSKQVRESYAKWWKAKVAESDFLSKHFGEKNLTSSTLTTRRSAPSISFAKSTTAPETSVAAGEKFELSQSETIIKNSYVEEGPAISEKKSPQDFGTFFNVVFVTRPDSVASCNTMTNADIENGYLREGSSSDNLVETELNEKRAIPNHYVDSSEFIRHSHDSTQ